MLPSESGELRLTYVGWLSMTEYRFKVGDLVRVWVSVSARPGEGAVDAITKNHISGIHEVTCLLPSMDNGEPQYRIKCCADRGERVVRECQLASAVHFPQSRR
jgi:hypothetical protein